MEDLQMVKVVLAAAAAIVFELALLLYLSYWDWLHLLELWF